MKRTLSFLMGFPLLCCVPGCTNTQRARRRIDSGRRIDRVSLVHAVISALLQTKARTKNPPELGGVSSSGASATDATENYFGTSPLAQLDADHFLMKFMGSPQFGYPPDNPGSQAHVRLLRVPPRIAQCL